MAFFRHFLIAKLFLFVYCQGPSDSDDTPIEVKIMALSYPAQISEGAAPGSVVAHVEVEDPNNFDDKIDCSTGNDNFILHRLYSNEFKLVLFKHLDRELQALHEVSVICRSLVSLKESSVNLEILVLDENDNSPIFSRDKYYVEVPENNVFGEVVAQVMATDNDVGGNGAVRYMLSSNNDNRFGIDSITGEVTVSTILDFEVMTKIELPVIAIDQGLPPLTGSSKVIIQVIDVDDQ